MTENKKTKKTTSIYPKTLRGFFVVQCNPNFPLKVWSDDPSDSIELKPLKKFGILINYHLKGSRVLFADKAA